MRLLVVRHARAGTEREFAATGLPDDLRPLTAEGEERMRLGARGLRRLVGTVDLVATSPLLRARRTADLIAAALDAPPVVELDELRPKTPPEALAGWLRGAGARETVAIVGHGTHLAELVGWLLTGKERPIGTIRKGAAVMLELRERKGRGARSGRLLWSLTPRQLRILGG